MRPALMSHVPDYSCLQDGSALWLRWNLCAVLRRLSQSIAQYRGKFRCVDFIPDQ